MGWVPIYERPRRFVDIETSGLSYKENGEIDYDLHEILEITILDDKGVPLLDTKVKPVQIETAEPKALEVNGYTEKEWQDAPTLQELAPTIVEHLKYAVIVGHNAPQFDYPRLKHWVSKYTKSRKMGYHVIDTMTLVEEHLVPLGCPSLGLKPSCAFVGIKTDLAHRSLPDTEACRRLYFRLRKASVLQRVWWWARNKVIQWTALLQKSN